MSQFVTYEVAVELKKRGFHEECTYYYDSVQFVCSGNAKVDWNQSDFLVSRPSCEQASNWLMKQPSVVNMLVEILKMADGQE